MDASAVAAQTTNEPTLADFLPELLQFPGWRLIVVLLILIKETFR